MFAHPGSRATESVESVSEAYLEWRVQDGLVQLGELEFGETFQLPPLNVKRSVPATEVVLQSGAGLVLLEKPLPVRWRYPGVKTKFNDAWFLGYSNDEEGVIDHHTVVKRGRQWPAAVAPHYRSASLRYYRAREGARISAQYFSSTWSPELPVHEDRGTGNDLLGVLEFFDVKTLRAGDGLHWEHPFGRAHSFGNLPEEVMSTGEFAIPVRRPTTAPGWSSWHACEFLRCFSSAEWPLLLEAVDRQFYSEIFPSGAPGTWVRTLRERMERLKGPRPPAEAPPHTGCFHGYDGCEVTLPNTAAGRLMWELTAAKRPIFVVDSPRVGACYIFTEREDAEFWACGAISFGEARLRAAAFIVHTDGWEREVELALTKLEVVKPS